MMWTCRSEAVDHRLTEDEYGRPSGFSFSIAVLFRTDHASQGFNISDKPDVTSMIVIRLVKILSGIRPRIILPR